jgi:potassium/hydrogen antiporter
VASALIQGTTVSWVARRLRLSALAGTGGTVDPLDLVAAGDRDIVEFRVNAGSQAAGRRLLDLGLPHGALVVLIQRGDHSFVPTGGSMFKPAIDCQFSQISLSVRSSRPSLTCNRGRFAQDRVWAS